MAIDGGAIGGYWEMGRLWMDRQPNTIRMMAMTQAKTGRSRKNFDNIASPCWLAVGFNGWSSAPHLWDSPPGFHRLWTGPP